MKLLTRLGRRDEATAALATAGERAGSAPPAVRARIRTLQSALALREGSASDALAFAEEAVAASPGAESLSALARAQARLGLVGARATADRAVAAGPDAPGAHLASGDARLAARLDAEAEAAYRRAAEIDPRSAEAGAGLARALAARGQAAPALEAARAAVQADPQAAEAQAALGLAALAQDPEDKKGEAVGAVQQAVLPRAEKPAAEAPARPGLREPGAARPGSNGLRRGRGTGPDLAVAAHRRPGRPSAPGRRRRRSCLPARAPRGVPDDR